MSRDPVVVVPGDLDVEDRIAGPVTFRMAAWLAAAAAGVALLAAAHGAAAPTALGVVVVVVGITGAWWRPGGRPVAAWVAPLLAYRKRRRSHGTAVDDDPMPEPDVTVEPEPTTDEPAPRRAVPTWRHGRVVAGVATGALALTAALVLVGSRDGARPPAAPVADVSAPEPTADPTVVVVVPVDPFTGWEVGGDVVDPLCGC